MNSLSQLFWQASIEEIVKGYVYDNVNEEFICLICGETFEKGKIYKDNEEYYEAEKYTRLHIVKEHKSMFDYLLNLNKKLTGLTDHQKTLINLFYMGYNDAEVVKEIGGSTSTIRTHRFSLREKEKQAKLFLAIMKLLELRGQDKENQNNEFIPVHRGATMLDERYAITEEENEKILTIYFKNGLEGPLSSFPVKKEKRKIAILRHIAKRFEVGVNYTEKEVNQILKAVYEDYVLIRRYLIEYGFLDREKDCSKYWVIE